MNGAIQGIPIPDNYPLRDDSTGDGSRFAAGLLCGFARGLDIGASVRVAFIAAASVGQKGGPRVTRKFSEILELSGTRLSRVGFQP